MLLFWLLQFLHPIKVPFPAPSLVGLITANALLSSALLLIGLFFQPVKFVFGIQCFTPFALRWLVICLVVSIAGFIVIKIWGTLTELPVAFMWSVVYIAVFALLRLALLPLLV
jgi:hypothetical protein